MLVPVRLLLAFKPQVAPALLVAIASSTVVFSATPFLLPAIAADRDISLSAVGWISTGQLGGFVLASFLAGRLLRPERHVFIIGAVLGVLSNLSSAVAPNLALLTIARGISGLSLGLAAWFGWQAAFGDNGRTGDVAVIGPLVGVVSAPAVSLLIHTAGVNWLFVVLAAITGLPLLCAQRIEQSVAPIDRGERHSATRAARLILLALGLITMGGSTVFVYAAAIGTGLNGLSAGAVALLFSGNALAGIPSARWQGR